MRRRLVGVEIGGPSLGAYSEGSMVDFFPVLRDGEHVGRVTSACHSSRLERNIGFAMVAVELEALGTELEVDTPHGRVATVVVEKPFIGPKKEIPKRALGAAVGGGSGPAGDG